MIGKTNVAGNFKYGMLFNELNSSGFPTDLVIKSTAVPENAFRPSASSNSFFRYLTKFEIQALENGIDISAFYDTFYKLSSSALKMKLKVKSLAYSCFYNLRCNDAKVWISSDCETIDGASSNSCPFYMSYTVKFYCEAKKKPSGWGRYWNYCYNNTTSGPGTTMWGVTEATFDTL